jgi:uncharacterized protein YjbJ (UPF0337 family)
MKLETLLGRALQVAGKLFQVWGELTGNELRRLRGYQMVAVGQMRVLGAEAAQLLRYCTPRQVLELGPALHHATRFKSTRREP